MYIDVFKYYEPSNFVRFFSYKEEVTILVKKKVEELELWAGN